ncbi:MalM family protein [Aestuariibaculum marinum]|uniref:Lipoprotein n=1 Tax=Aestuariibaculum marinum TaxID=2683592 RepID=A0A8J6PWZ6_9FLAO|nr:MalM family protein [Aestuariibaculum marinum]MBD0822645.1 hypothetical protein [Aestuariibaculum marinum]
MRKVNIIYLCLLILNISSCSYSNYQKSVVSEHRKTLEEKEVNFFSYKDFNYIPIKEKYSFKINGEDKTFNFEEGKSYFKAFKINPQTGNYLLVVKSRAYGGQNIVFKKPTLLMPKIILLDKNKDVLALDSELISSTFSSEYNLSRSYLINMELGPLVEYVVVYTDPSFAGKIIDNPQRMNAYYAGNGMVGFSTVPGTPKALSIEGNMVIKIKQPNFLK